MDSNPTQTDGRQHTGIWQRGRSTVEWRPTPLPLPHGGDGKPWAGQPTTTDATVHSKGYGALPNGYYNAVQWHGQSEVGPLSPTGQRFTRYGIGHTHLPSGARAGILPAARELSNYTRQHGVSVLGTWPNNAGPILPAEHFAAPPEPGPVKNMAKDSPSGFTANSPDTANVTPAAPPLSRSPLPADVKAALAADRFLSSSSRAYTAGHLSPSQHRAKVVPFPEAFRTGELLASLSLSLPLSLSLSPPIQ